AISLVVAGILIMNVMLIAISQRTAEIGLLKAIGAPGKQIQQLFLAEAVMLSMVGAGAGLLLSAGGVLFLEWLFPSFPVAVPYWSPPAAVGIAMATGVIFGVLPARRAARLDPVAALSRR
ncbi:MAG: FtsX-like permease family protein, partial [Desulfobacteraceae bacterium]